LYQQITHDQFTLSYRIYGDGPEVLIAFHGFGCDATDFEAFEPLLKEKYTIYAFDLFYHGESPAPDEDFPPANPSVMAHMIEKLLWKDKRVKFSILAYSLGGRIALCLVQKLPHRINEVFLVAPDGLKKEWHEDFVARTFVGKMIYKRLINHPKTFFSLINFFVSIKVIHPKLKQFIELNLDSVDKRQKVFNTWRVFRHMRPDLSVVAHYINTKSIRLELFFGKYDQIIQPKLGNRLHKRVKRRSKLHLLETGHQLLTKAEEISKVILKR